MPPVGALVVSEQRPWWAFGCSGEMTARDIANMRRMNLHLLALVAAFGVALFTLGADSVTSPWAALVVLPVLVVGVGLFRAARRFLGEADELTRRMHVDAMAVAFGVGVVAALLELPLQKASDIVGTWWLHELSEISDPFLWMMLAYSFVVVRLQRAYSR